jgi:hypothetical protein
MEKGQLSGLPIPRHPWPLSHRSLVRRQLPPQARTVLGVRFCGARRAAGVGGHGLRRSTASADENRRLLGKAIVLCALVCLRRRFYSNGVYVIGGRRWGLKWLHKWKSCRPEYPWCPQKMSEVIQSPMVNPPAVATMDHVASSPRIVGRNRHRRAAPSA